MRSDDTMVPECYQVIKGLDMTINSMLYKALGVIAACVLVMMGFSTAVYAQSGVPSKDDAQTGSITVIAAKNTGVLSSPVSGVTFELHKVVGYDVFDAQQWSEIKKREQNKDFSDLKTEKVTEFGPSDSEGRTKTISAEPGFYVLKAQGAHKDQYTDSYFTLPSQDSDGQWSYDLTAYPKGKADPTPTDPDHKPSEGVNPLPEKPSKAQGAAVQSGGVELQKDMIFGGLFALLVAAAASAYMTYRKLRGQKD